MSSAWYQSTPDAGRIPPEVAERALEWLLELQGDDVRPEVLAGWQCWRESHPDHERAWHRIESVQGRLHSLASPLTAEIAQAALAPATSPQRRRVLKTLAVLAFAGGLTVTVEQRAPWREWMSDYRTAVGERRTVALADGTTLVLNTATALNVAFTDSERRVRLIAGEILVTTARDPQLVSRPFLVETAQGTARALGTRYSVRQQDGATDVSVFEHAVEIRPRGNADRALVLRAGFRASYTEQLATAQGEAQASSITWADGFILARSMRLDAFMNELGRYSRATLSCDPAVAGLRVSGSFPLDNMQKVLDTLSSTLDVRAEAVTRFWGQDEIRILPVNRAGRG